MRNVFNFCLGFVAFAAGAICAATCLYQIKVVPEIERQARFESDMKKFFVENSVLIERMKMRNEQLKSEIGIVKERLANPLGFGALRPQEPESAAPGGP